MYFYPNQTNEIVFSLMAAFIFNKRNVTVLCSQKTIMTNIFSNPKCSWEWSGSTKVAKKQNVV